MTSSKDLAGPSKERPTNVSIPSPSMRTQLVGESLDLGMIKLNTMTKNLGHVTIYFSQMSLYKVYVVHNVTVMKMKFREGTMIK